MKTLYALLGGLAAAAVIAAAFKLSHSFEHRRKLAELAPERGRRGGESAPEASDEVQRLRAEVRAKDQLLASLLASRVSPGANLPGSPAPPPTTASPEDRVSALLDERMSGARKDTAKASEMEQAVRALTTSQLMGKAKVASLSCGPRLCKMSLTADNEQDLNQSMADMGSQLPKLFGAAAVHRLSDGQTVMYLARSGEDLAVPRAADR